MFTDYDSKLVAEWPTIFFVFNHREYSWCSTCIIFYVETAKSYLEGHGLQCQGNLKANLGVLCFETVAIAQKNKIDA